MYDDKVHSIYEQRQKQRELRAYMIGCVADWISTTSEVDREVRNSFCGVCKYKFLIQLSMASSCGVRSIGVLVICSCCCC